MAPPTITGRSQGLYPERPLAGRNGRIRGWLGSAWNSMFPNGLIGPTPGGGAATAATGVPHRAPNSLSEYLGGQPSSPLMPSAGGQAGMSTARQAAPWQGPRQPPSPQTLNGRGPLQRFGQEGLSPLFNIPPQSPYRPGSAPGMSVLGGGEMAAQDSIQATIDQIRFDRENLRDMRMRQGELKQGQFDQTWGEYATQAPLMNQRVSPEFGYAAQGLGPGGVAPMTPEEQAYMGRRNAYADQPGTSQMYDRFGGGPLTGEALRGFAPSALNNDYDGQVRMQVGGYGSPLSGPLGESRDPEFSDKAVAGRQMERQMRIAADQQEDGSSPRLRAARQAIDARREAMGLRRSDDLQGRIADRDAARTERLQRAQAQNLSRRGISPLSAEGQALAPGLFGSLRAQRSGTPAEWEGSPLTLLRPDGSTQTVQPVPQKEKASPLASTQAQIAMQALQQRPVFTSLGIQVGEGEEGPSVYDVANAVDTKIVQQGSDLPADELDDLHQWAVQVSKTATEDNDPFNQASWLSNSVSEANQKKWKALSQISLGDRTAVKKWWEDYKKPAMSQDAWLFR